MEGKNGFDAVKIGDAVSVTKTVSESDAYLFAGITGDFHPIHVNEEFCRATQFGRRLVHGALSLGFLAAAATKLAEMIGSPESAPHRYDVRFRRPVFFGDTITTTLRIVEKNPDTGDLMLEATITNQAGETVTRGSASMRVRSGGCARPEAAVAS